MVIEHVFPNQIKLAADCERYKADVVQLRTKYEEQLSRFVYITQ